MKARRRSQLTRQWYVTSIGTHILQDSGFDVVTSIKKRYGHVAWREVTERWYAEFYNDEPEIQYFNNLQQAKEWVEILAALRY